MATADDATGLKVSALFHSKIVANPGFIEQR
jgi:hypothetical protein